MRLMGQLVLLQRPRPATPAALGLLKSILEPRDFARLCELAKEWRTDRVLRRLEAMLVVLDRDHLLLVSGTGDVIQPTDNVLGIGSGGAYALAAARALLTHTQLKPGEVVRAGLEIAGDICVYTNRQIEVVELT